MEEYNATLTEHAENPAEGMDSGSRSSKTKRSADGTIGGGFGGLISEPTFFDFKWILSGYSILAAMFNEIGYNFIL